MIFDPGSSGKPRAAQQDREAIARRILREIGFRCGRVPLDQSDDDIFSNPFPQFGIDDIPCPANLFVRRNVGSRPVGIRDEGDIKLRMKSFSQPQQRQHRVVGGCQMPPQVKHPIPARRYFPQDFLGQRELQTACPPDRFGSSILSARELRKRGRFPCLHLLSTTNGCRATAEYSRRYPRRTSCTDHPIRSRYAASPVSCPASGRGETEAAAQCRIRRSPRRRCRLFVKHADQRLLVDDRPARCIDQPGRWLHCSPAPAAPTRPRVRLLNTKWIVRMSAARTAGPWTPGLRRPLWRPLASCSGSRQSDCIPKALPTRATCDPIRPSPRTPRVFPRRSAPTVCCQPPDRTELLSVTRCRAEARISAQVNSIVGSAVCLCEPPRSHARPRRRHRSTRFQVRSRQ